MSFIGAAADAAAAAIAAASAANAALDLANAIAQINKKANDAAVNVIKRGDNNDVVPELGLEGCDVAWAEYGRCSVELYLAGPDVLQAAYNASSSVGYVRGVPEGCLAVVTSLSCPGEGEIAPAVCGEDCFAYEGISIELWELLASVMEGKDPKGKDRKGNQTVPAGEAVNGKKQKADEGDVVGKGKAEGKKLGSENEGEDLAGEKGGYGKKAKEVVVKEGKVAEDEVEYPEVDAKKGKKVDDEAEHPEVDAKRPIRVVVDGKGHYKRHRSV